MATYTTTLAELDALLQSLPENTAETPYSIKITEFSGASIATVLNNNRSKKVDLSETVMPDDWDWHGKFRNAYALVIPPEIPSSVTNMRECFFYCSSLRKPPKRIPEGVTDMYSAFEGCSNLEETPIFPQNLESLYRTFVNCQKLKTVHTIPDNVNNMANTFEYCYSLTTIPNFPNNENLKLGNCFSMCSSLESVPDITAPIKGLHNTFGGCKSLKEAPRLPSTINTLSESFSYCTSLTHTRDWSNLDFDNITVTDCFIGCTSLERINIKKIEDTDEYTMFHLQKKDSECSYNIFGKDIEISNTESFDFDKVQVTGYVDELLIGNSDSLSTELAKKIYYDKVQVSNSEKDFSPDDPHMVIWAKDKEKIKSNVKVLKAEQDGNGNDITNTYATKSSLTNYANVYVGSSAPASSETAKLWVVV